MLLLLKKMVSLPREDVANPKKEGAQDGRQCHNLLSSQERISSGLLRIRPMHMQHTFETALVVTEAFIIDMKPPHFGMLL